MVACQGFGQRCVAARDGLQDVGVLVPDVARGLVLHQHLAHHALRLRPVRGQDGGDQRVARQPVDELVELQVGRKSNMIISGGENIYPSEVEAVLAAHPAVQDVAVVGLPDAKWGESVLAVVVPRHGAQVRHAELEAWCRERIAGFKRPRAYMLITEAQMPRTATGKIQHRLLREQVTASQGIEQA